MTVTCSPAAGTTATRALERIASLVAPALDEVAGRLDPELQGPVRHHLAGGGKRVRAALVLLGAAAVGAVLDVAMPGAIAIELVHNFSLVHDDIIDGDDERRHQPTVWRAYGTGPAIVAGDALAILALQVLLEEPTPERVHAATYLAEATQAMIAGQADDMAFERRDAVSVGECLCMEIKKTAALLACAASLGAILGGASALEVSALAEFGAQVGAAFQAVDDVLGIWGDPERTGKPTGSDLVQHKKTLPVAIALHRAGGEAPALHRLLASDLTGTEVTRAAQLLEAYGAREEALALADGYLGRALAALDRLPLAPGPRDELAAIARFVTERDR